MTYDPDNPLTWRDAEGNLVPEYLADVPQPPASPPKLTKNGKKMGRPKKTPLEETTNENK